MKKIEEPMKMTRIERTMTPEQHLEAALELYPEQPKPGDVVSFFQSDVARAERQLFLARWKMLKGALPC